MKNLISITITAILLSAACGNDGGGSSSGGEDLSNSFSAGEMVTYTVNAVDFKMVWVPGGITFPTGTDDSGSATVDDAYFIAETEVTYELWNTVKTWATSNGYTFANAGIMGDGSGDTNQHPVTTINWRDAMVWSNALTEYYNAQNGTSLEPVYYSDAAYATPIRSSADGSYASSVNSTAGSFDDPYVNISAKGFRLPTADEWELAARYKGSDSANGAIEYPVSSGYYWTPGDYASGATADYNDAVATSDVAWISTNSSSSTHEVKTKTANALGLYDMSGNVYEWNFDWSSVGSNRVNRGSSWSNTMTNAQVGYLSYNYPYYEFLNYGFGFRLARNP